MYFLLRFIPKNHLSFLIGKLVQLRSPEFLAKWFVAWFARRYQVNLSEASKPLKEYKCLGDFFVRDLKPGARIIVGDLVSPVDGEIVEHDRITDGRLIQVKGRDYSVSDLLKEAVLSQKYQQGYFISIYLSPKDYHHIHSPVTGRIVKSIYIPGMLWPVNSWSVNNIDALFTVNERIASVIESQFGLLTVVMVGATNVGGISLEYDDLVANQHPSMFHRRGIANVRNYQSGFSVNVGERIASFHMGSSVVLLFEPGQFVSTKLLKSGPIKLGNSLN